MTLNRLEELQTVIRKVSPWVDRTCVVDGGSTDGTIEWLDSDECQDLNVDYEVHKQVRLARGNHTPGERNHYLKMAGNSGWILVTDTDEFLEELACRNLRNLVIKAEENGCDGIAFNAHDIWTYETGEVYDSVSNYYNPTFFKVYRGIHYAGHTHSRIVRPGSPEKWMQTKLQYHHTKTERRMWHNSTYLWWTTAKIADNAIDVPEWQQFHELMGDYDYYDWHEFNKVMEAGQVPEEVCQWFIDHKEAESPEERAWFVWYFIFRHPELNTQKLSNRDKDWDYVQVSKAKREQQ